MQHPPPKFAQLTSTLQSISYNETSSSRELTLGGSGGFGRELGDKGSGSDCRVDGLKGTHFSSDQP